MQTWTFSEGKQAVQSDRFEFPTEQDFTWIVINHQELDAVLSQLEKHNGFKLHPEHYEDCFNVNHPCFFDGLANYKLLIFRSLNVANNNINADTQSIAFILHERFLITVHEDDSAIENVIKRVNDTSRTLRAKTPDVLLYQILIFVVDKFLKLRENLSEQFSKWQELLLSHGKRFRAWHEFLNYKNSTQRFYILCEGQLDAVDQWRQVVESESIDVDNGHAHARVHLADLASHIRRGLKFSQQLQYQVDSLMQLHYSLMTSVTNQVVQVLTVISAVFLPLMLITGIFGMNFEHMPFLSWKIGFYGVIAFMAVIILILLSIFKSKKWT